MSYLRSQISNTVSIASLIVVALGMFVVPQHAYAFVGDVKVTVMREGGLGALSGATVEVQCTGGTYTQLMGSPTTDGSGIVQALPALASSCDDGDDLNIRITKTGYVQKVDAHSAGYAILSNPNDFSVTNFQFGVKVGVKDELNNPLLDGSVQVGTTYTTTCSEGDTSGAYRNYYCAAPAGAGVGTSLSAFKEGFVWNPDSSGAYTKRTTNAQSQSTTNVTLDYGHVVAADDSSLTVTADVDLEGSEVTCIFGGSGSRFTDNDGFISGDLYFCAIPTGSGSSSVRVQKEGFSPQNFSVDRRDNPTDDQYGLDITTYTDSDYYDDPHNYEGLRLRVQTELGDDLSGATVTYDGNSCSNNDWYNDGDYYCPSINGSGTLSVSKDGYVATSSPAIATVDGEQRNFGTATVKYAYKITSVTAEATSANITSSLSSLAVGDGLAQQNCVLSGGAWYCPVLLTESGDGTMIGHVQKNGYVGQTYALDAGTNRGDDTSPQVTDTISDVQYAYKLDSFISEQNEAPVTPDTVTVGGTSCTLASGAWYCPTFVTEGGVSAEVTASGYVNKSASLSTRGSNGSPQVAPVVTGILYQVKVVTADEFGTATGADTLTIDSTSADYVSDNSYWFAKSGSEMSLVGQKNGFIDANTTNSALASIFTDPTEQLVITLGDNDADTDGSVTDTANIKGFEYRLRSSALESELGGTITDIASATLTASTNTNTQCAPGADTALLTQNGTLIYGCAVHDNQIYAALVGDGDDRFVLTLSHVTADGGAANGANFTYAAFNDSEGVIHDATTQDTFCVGAECSADLAVPSGFTYPLLVTVTDQFGTGINADSLTSASYAGGNVYATSGSNAYFGNAGSSQNLYVSKNGYVPGNVTNSAFTPNVSTNQTQQTHIVMGNYESVSDPIPAGEATTVRGLEYKLKSNILTSELGEAITNIDDGTGNITITAAPETGTTVVSYIAKDNVIYIAAYGDGDNDDGVYVQLQGVTAGSGQVNGASFVRSLITDTGDDVLSDSTAAQETFDVGDDSATLYNATGFLYPLKVTVNDQLNNPITGLTATLGGVGPYKTDTNILYFAATTGGATLHISKDGYVDAETTNTALGHTSSGQTSQTTLTLDDAHGALGYPGYSITEGSSYAASGLYFGQRIILEDANENPIDGATVTIEADPTIICTVVSNIAYCPVPAHMVPVTFSVSVTIPGFASNTSEHTNARSSNADSQGQITIDDIGYAVKVVAIVDELGNNIMPTTGEPFTLSGDGIISQTYDADANAWNIAADDADGETLSVSVSGYVTDSVVIDVGGGQKRVAFGGDSEEDYNADAVLFPLKVRVAEESGYEVSGATVTYDGRSSTATVGNTAYFTSSGETSDVVVAKDGFVTVTQSQAVDNTAQSNIAVFIDHALRVIVYDGDSNTDKLAGVTVTAGSGYAVSCAEGGGPTAGQYYCVVPLASQAGGIGKVQKTGYTTRTFTAGTRAEADTAQITQIIHLYPNEDAEAPTVIAEYPLHPETEISVNVHPYVDFFEVMDPATITSSTVRLCDVADADCSDGISVEVALTNGGTRAVMTPDAPLESDHGYWIYVTTGVTDLAGNHLALAYGGFNTTSFTTASADTPTVSAQYPEATATDVATSTHPYIDFSTAIDPDTVTSSTVALCFGWDDTCSRTVIPVTLAVSNGNSRVTLIPDEPLNTETRYWIQVKVGVHSALDVPVVAYGVTGFSPDFGTTFITIAGDTPTPPTVVGQSPAVDASDVAVNVHPYVDFSTAMNPTTISEDTVLLCEVSDETCASPIAASVSVSGGGTRATITPNASLAHDTGYYLKVTTDVQNLSGTPLADDYASSDTFTTAAAADGSLAVDHVSLTKSVATKDDEFDDGWAWTFEVTVPDTETDLQMSFDDFTGPGSLPAAGNIEFYSEQSDSDPIIISAAGAGSEWSDVMNVTGDLDEDTPGRQIEIIVKAKVPAETVDGSYSTSFGIQTNEPIEPASFGDEDGGDVPPADFSVSVIAPVGSITEWTPVIDWGNAATCEYSFDVTTFIAADCGANGSDILAPVFGPGTLSIHAMDVDANEATNSADFDYEAATPPEDPPPSDPPPEDPPTP